MDPSTARSPRWHRARHHEHRDHGPDSDHAVPFVTALRRQSAAAPVRAVHLGLGSFFRAHQAWYTWRSPGGETWGTAAFSGRSSKLADDLSAQGGLYTLVTRSPEGDAHDVVTSVSRSHAGGDHGAWLAYLSDPDVVLATTTVTEQGYHLGPTVHLALDSEPVRHDVGSLRAGDPATPLLTAPGRLLAGLRARRNADAGPFTLVPCDNLPGNGQVLAGVLRDLADAVDQGLTAWLAENLTCASTVVDRITPATTQDDVHAVRNATGRHDLAPVVTEPFSEWVIAGLDTAVVPRWQDAGAIRTDDIAPYEDRKLWLLNGAHSLLAYAGPLRGHETVAAAVADPVCRSWVQDWWAEAASHVQLPADEVARYQAALLERFSNPRTRHRLDQIAADGSLKLGIRVLPVLRRERAAGRAATGAARALAAWVLHLREGESVRDPHAEVLQRAAATTLPASIRAVLAELDAEVAADDDLVATVTHHAADLVAR